MMKLRYLPVFIIFLLLYCPGKYKPSVKKIDVHYLSSLHDDLYRDEPLMAGVQHDTGFVIGHLMPAYPVMTTVLGKLGFYRLLETAGIDFVISDSALFLPRSSTCYVIPSSSGYAIMNYEGVRFAIFAHDRDTLDIDAEVKRAIVEQRSDILWMIGRDFLDTPPRHIQFFIENRGLADTSMTPITTVTDTGIIDRVRDFRSVVERTLATPVALEGMTLSDYVLSQVAETANTDILLYPASLFRDSMTADTITLKDMIENVAFEMRYKKNSRMLRSEIQGMIQKDDYRVWGTLQDTNAVLLPDPQGAFLFTFYFPIDLSEN
jgi:hypothetical protein